MPAELPPKDYIDSVHFPDRVALSPIGVVRSSHRERHGTPHQAVLHADPRQRPDERARIDLFPARVPAAALQDLDGFDYIYADAFPDAAAGWVDRVDRRTEQSQP